jgi:hypothetical protein
MPEQLVHRLHTRGFAKRVSTLHRKAFGEEQKLSHSRNVSDAQVKNNCTAVAQ